MNTNAIFSLNNEETFIYQKGKPIAVIIDIEKYKKLKELEEIFEDLLIEEEIKERIKDLDKKKTYELEEIVEKLELEGNI